jgi:hypothetical protein
MRTALAIPLVLVLVILGGSAAGYYAYLHYDVPGAYGILGVILLLVIVFTALQSKFPDKRR